MISRLFKKDEFLARFTSAERLALHRLSLADTPQGNAAALAWQTFTAAPHIVTSSPTLRTTMDGLVTLGVLSAERKTAILDS